MENNETPIIQQEQPSAEEVQRHISAAFDSVSLINRVINGEDMVNQSVENKKSTVERNAGHLKLMMAKTWFDDGLTELQKSEIETCISSSDTYLTSN